jgi:predicted SnoaL-like aldol condensation-catalyzing enzyme
MIDGPTSASDLDHTEANKALMQRYMDDLLAATRRETFLSYSNGIQYIQHNPWVADTIPGLIAGLKALAAKGQTVVYKRVHQILGEGDFVLVVTEEHWDTLEIIPPRGEWKNGNGKF